MVVCLYLDFGVELLQEHRPITFAGWTGLRTVLVASQILLYVTNKHLT